MIREYRIFIKKRILTMGKLFYSNRESEVMHIFEQKLAE